MIHRIVGRSLVFIAFAQIGLGVQLIRAEEPADSKMTIVEQLILGWGIALIFVFLYFEIELQFGLEKGPMAKFKLIADGIGSYCGKREDEERCLRWCCGSCLDPNEDEGGGDERGTAKARKTKTKKKAKMLGQAKAKSASQRKILSNKDRVDILSQNSPEHLESWPYATKIAKAYEKNNLFTDDTTLSRFASSNQLLKRERLTLEEAKEAGLSEEQFRAMDIDNDGQVTLEEMTRMITSRMSSRTSNHLTHAPNSPNSIVAGGDGSPEGGRTSKRVGFDGPVALRPSPLSPDKGVAFEDVEGVEMVLKETKEQTVKATKGGHRMVAQSSEIEIAV